jgi:hypothetical protein
MFCRIVWITLIVVICLFLEFFIDHVFRTRLWNHLKGLECVASRSVGREEASPTFPEALPTSPKKSPRTEAKQLASIASALKA